MKRYLSCCGRSRPSPCRVAPAWAETSSGRRPARRIPRPDGGRRRAQGPALQDRVERVPGRRSAARGPERRGHRYRHRRRCAIHLRGRLGRADPGHHGHASRPGRPRHPGASRFSRPDRSPISRASASAPAADPSAISWCSPPWKTPSLPKSDVTLSFLLPAEAKAALTSGSLDAWSTWEPYTSQLVLSGEARIVRDGQGITPGLGFQAAHVEAIEAKRAELEDFVRRLAKARVWGPRTTRPTPQPGPSSSACPRKSRCAGSPAANIRPVPIDAEVVAGRAAHHRPLRSQWADPEADQSLRRSSTRRSTRRSSAARRKRPRADATNHARDCASAAATSADAQPDPYPRMAKSAGVSADRRHERFRLEHHRPARAPRPRPWRRTSSR